MAASSSSTAGSTMVRSMWHMMVRPRSAPSRRMKSTISSGSRSCRPGWIISGAPVSRCASTAARTTFRSFAVHGQVVPISPMKPARTPVSPTPGVSSATISRATPSTVFASMSGGCEAAT